jgi:hypothetical protein
LSGAITFISLKYSIPQPACKVLLETWSAGRTKHPGVSHSASWMALKTFPKEDIQGSVRCLKALSILVHWTVPWTPASGRQVKVSWAPTPGKGVHDRTLTGESGRTP